MKRIDFDEVEKDLDCWLKAAIYFKEKAKKEGNHFGENYFDGQIHIINEVIQSISNNTYY